ncbi:conserved hypothetical protein [Kribbella flavida DSM 17836]|uniref:DUF3224 domain-containing protein n=1 Tax=Kribbella flavida (strain DSM 17836 / JCM 10339 / NBRC 14399) TaxID=479435 RepID=D2PNC1_KRIFD|nr:DUF3224 domain-containing protein [Kribbella flavida]ADB34605.1 conserved hypothetical protein [Kribbella flavida DSM 17836]
MKFTQPFEITKWDQSTYDDADDVELGRATVGKTFADGELVGTSSAELLMVGTPAGPAAYTAVERFTGTLDGREGSFVMVHGASAEETASHGKVVASAGALTGLSGTVLYEHDDQGPRLTLDYELPG